MSYGRGDDLAPLVLEVYDRDGTYLDDVVEPLGCAFTVKWNGFGYGTLTLDHDDDKAEALTEHGSSMIVRYRHDPLAPLDPMYLMSGNVKERELSGDAAGRVRVFDIADDFVLLNDLTGYPNPSGTDAEQGDDDAYYSITGPAETVLKTLITANLAHYPQPVVVAPDLGRGPVISVSLRFHPLYDRVWPAMDTTGLTWTVRRDPATGARVVDCTPTDTYPELLTERSGIVAPGGRIRLVEPQATRAMVLGQGEGRERIAKFVAPGGSRTTRTPLEVEWNLVREVTIDARDLDDPAALPARGLTKLAELGPKAVGTVKLAESEDFRMFVAVQLGTAVEVELNGQPAVTDRIRSATLQWDADDGLTVVPAIGDAPADQYDALGRALANVVRNQRATLLGK